MFRTVLAFHVKRLSAAYHKTSVLGTQPRRKYVPEDWYIVDAGPGGGFELVICNSKTPEATWYTPEGMTAEEIFAIPDAKQYWSTVEQVKAYKEEAAVLKSKSDGKDLIDQFAEQQSQVTELSDQDDIHTNKSHK